ncbi:MAG: DUF4974 domain-containing protein [Prolixibacteraceae bacterium]|jgi:ferric-dicitrate binding protein FerR (iron transport regulator)|nr:DUF4974 domain-containing protein [Prolixibacteraceae bacterium]
MKLELIIKYIEGDSDQMVIDKVEQWLSSGPENRRYLEKVKKIWFAVDELKALAAIDVNKDWELVERRLTEKSSRLHAKRKVLAWNDPFVKIAAALIVGILITSVFFYVNRKPVPVTQAVASRYEVIVPDGQKSNLVLPDGTKVMVNAGSRLFLPKESEPDKREVWLDGEAFFEVTKNPHLPFVVHTSDIQVKVLGTTFNVRAYEDEKLFETTLVEGRVALSRTGENGQDISLSPDHKAIYVKSKDAKLGAALQREFGEHLKVEQIMVSGRISPESAISWIQGKLTFEDEYFDVIVRRLERYYGVQIHIADESLKNMKYTGTIKNISLDQALRALQTTTPFNYTHKDQDVTITK